MSLLRKDNIQKEKYGDTRIEGFFKDCEKLFNVCMAKFGGIGPFTIFSGGNDASDYQLAADMVKQYKELKDLVKDYDETVRYQTDKLDELQEGMEKLNKKLEALYELQKDGNKKMPKIVKANEES